MAQKLYTGPCEDCGRQTTKKQQSRKGLRCIDCGIRAATRAAYEMFTKSGPAWDRFTESLAVSKRQASTDQGE